MPTIHVCPLHEVEMEVALWRPSRLLTMLSEDGDPPPTPAPLTSRDHLALTFHDINYPVDGHTHPTPEIVAAILDFTMAWDRRAPLLIHCWAGISRSTAAAFMTVCALKPDLDEREIAAGLRRASPTAMPNSLMIALADRQLGRKGRMISAVSAIGRGRTASHGQPFVLPQVCSA